MKNCTSLPRGVLCTVIAVCCLVSVVGFATYWANLSVYTVSYIRVKLHSNKPLLASWILPLWLTGTDGTKFLVGFLHRIIGTEWTLLCAIIVFSSSVTATYFFISWSTLGFNVCLGILNGIGTGAISLTTIQIVINRMGEQKSGIIISFVRSSIVFGGMLINQFVTLYLNPSNKSPDVVEVGTLRFFSQREVIESVPKLYLILGCSFCAMQLVCFGVMRATSSDEEKFVSRLCDSRSKVIFETCKVNSTEVGIRVNGYKFTARAIDSSVYDDTVHENLVKTDAKFYESIAEKEVCAHRKPVGENHVEVPKEKSYNSTELIDCCESNDNTSKLPDLNLGEIFRTVKFIVLCALMAFASISFIVINNYVKSYGQLWVDDDFELTAVWNVQLLTVVVGNMMWGAALDKYDSKSCLVFYFASLSILDLAVYFSPRFSKWLYYVAVSIAGGLGAPLYVIFLVCVAKEFGKTHFSTVAGLMHLPTAVVVTLFPILLEVLLERAGWFYVFGVAAMSNVLGLISVVLKWP